MSTIENEEIQRLESALARVTGELAEARKRTEGLEEQAACALADRDKARERVTRLLDERSGSVWLWEIGEDNDTGSLTCPVLIPADALRDLIAVPSAERTAAARMREALEPSGDTKAAYLGEFSFHDGLKKRVVPWTTIKEIMAAIRARAALAAPRRETGA